MHAHRSGVRPCKARRQTAGGPNVSAPEPAVARRRAGGVDTSGAYARVQAGTVTARSCGSMASTARSRHSSIVLPRVKHPGSTRRRDSRSALPDPPRPHRRQWRHHDPLQQPVPPHRHRPPPRRNTRAGPHPRHQQGLPATAQKREQCLETPVNGVPRHHIGGPNESAPEPAAAGRRSGTFDPVSAVSPSRDAMTPFATLQLVAAETYGPDLPLAPGRGGTRHHAATRRPLRRQEHH